MPYFIHPYTNKPIEIFSKEGEEFLSQYISPISKKTYKQKGGKNKLNLIYMAKPPYGGWVSFTAHLARKYNANLYKIGNKTESKNNGEPTLRDFGYGVKYQNISIDDASKLTNVLITAIDKNYYKYLDSFPNNTSLVIHDPTEIKERLINGEIFINIKTSNLIKF